MTTAFIERLRATVPPVAEPEVVTVEPPHPPARATPEQCLAAERRYAEDDAAAQALVRDVFRPLVEGFQTVMESGRVFCPGRVQVDRVPRGAHYCSYQATGTAFGGRGETGKKRDYYVRISAAAFCSGPLVLSVECRHDATRACRFTLPRAPLVVFAPKNVWGVEIDHASAGECLEKCAEACRNANQPQPCSE
jgi:hypothetical protein